MRPSLESATDDALDEVAGLYGVRRRAVLEILSRDHRCAACGRRPRFWNSWRFDLHHGRWAPGTSVTSAFYWTCGRLLCRVATALAREDS